MLLTFLGAVSLPGSGSPSCRPGESRISSVAAKGCRPAARSRYRASNRELSQAPGQEATGRGVAVVRAGLRRRRGARVDVCSAALAEGPRQDVMAARRRLRAARRLDLAARHDVHDRRPAGGGDDHRDRRDADRQLARPPHAARGCRRPGPARSRRAGSARRRPRDRRHHLPERLDLGRFECGRRQGPGLARGPRRGLVRFLQRQVECRAGRPEDHLDTGPRRDQRHPGADFARLRALVHAAECVLPDEGRPDDEEVGRPPSRRAHAGRRADHRRDAALAAGLLPRRHDRRGIQRAGRRPRRARTRRAARGHDRGGHLRDRLRPLHRGVRRGRASQSSSRWARTGPRPR